MEKKRCSSEEHEKIEASSYCPKCDVYMCNKCEIFHSKLCKNHQTLIIDHNINGDFFTGFCQEKELQMKLDFFCKNHNQLCCAACIAKIKKEQIGKHKDCDVCLIEEIKREKKDKLAQNIKLLEKLSNISQESINNLKIIFDEINKRKEELKNLIQKIFTKIRNELNNREDQLLINIDNYFEILFLKEDILKNYEKLPNKIKLSLEKCKLINKKEQIDNNKLSFLINECINIENNIKDIDTINENIKRYKSSNDFKIEFLPEEMEINNFSEKIKTFGKILFFNNKLSYSSIINNDYNKQYSIIKWISEKTNKNIIQIEPLFKMSENGHKCDDFHRYCDNKGPTLTLVKTKKNKIFGGFTPLSWKKEGGEINDKSNQSFIFSLNLMKKFDMINKGGKAIRCLKNEGPDFGDEDFSLMENMKKGRTFANSSCNYLSNYNLELTGSHAECETFETEQLEVYKVIF